MKVAQVCTAKIPSRRALGPIYQRPAGRPRRLAAPLAAAIALAAAPAAHAENLVVEGAGWGHGVGMSQWGALGYARHGYSDRQILAHYYSGTSLGSVSERTKIKVLVGRRVLTLPIETYVRGVVAAEMPSSWPAAALEAQAIASRTYALTTDAGGARFDVYSDTRSQVYEGRAAETPASNAAVAATAGQVVTYAGKPVTTYFFASSGGRTEDVQNSFIGSPPEPWLRGVVDRYESSASDWKVTIPFARAQRLLGRLVRGTFRGIEVLARGYSPRIVTALVLGSGGSTAVSGPELEWRLGLLSAWAHFFVQNGTSVTAEPDRSGRAASHRRHRRGSAPVVSAPAGGKVQASNGGVGAPGGG
ncbi:MAG TPA: SpoIID/LytB domain-containing protein [Solirubrobacteraceae bacterium]|nr:SpoIID/LytB domain-containing protein [Solirubrobacteraceae bacterium]